MNVAQRADTFKFEELIGVKPLVPPARRADEHPEDHAAARFLEASAVAVLHRGAGPALGVQGRHAETLGTARADLAGARSAGAVDRVP